MDIADKAEAQEAAQREASIKAACANTGPRLLHIGECHYCGDEVEEPKLFCNGTCATKFARKER